MPCSFGLLHADALDPQVVAGHLLGFLGDQR
jgi:hypothetical protein